MSGVLFIGPETSADLARSGSSLFRWLQVLYGVVALSNAGRYWRCRLLLGWVRGFSLTATPANLGELSRVQLLQEQLGYPRLPLVHVFAAERCADVAAVALVLVVLTPSQVLGLLPNASGLLASRPSPRRWLQTHWQHWRHHLPSGALARATLPVALILGLVWANEALPISARAQLRRDS